MKKRLAFRSYFPIFAAASFTQRSAFKLLGYPMNGKHSVIINHYCIIRKASNFYQIIFPTAHAQCFHIFELMQALAGFNTFYEVLTLILW